VTDIRTKTPADIDQVEILLDAAFGPGRIRNSAHVLRQGLEEVDGLSFVAADGGEIVGCIHFWPMTVVPEGGGTPPEGVLLLGPLAVHPDRHGNGIGQALVDRGLAAAKAQGHRAAILVGDPAYYGRFGFLRELVDGVHVPGEADQRRVLGGELVAGAWAGVRGTLKGG